MNQITLSSGEVIASHHFSRDLINEFNKNSNVKVNNLSQQQTDEEIWMTLSIPIKVRYIIYLAYRINGARSQSDIRFLMRVLSWSVRRMEKKWQQLMPNILDHIEKALQLRSLLQSFPKLSFVTAFTTFSQAALFANETRTLERAKLYALSQQLDQWINWDNIHNKPPNASGSLLAVLHHYHPDCSLAEILRHYDNKYQTRLEEAILLYKWSYQKQLLTTIELASFRREFIEILKQEEKDEEILEHMFFDYKINAASIIFDGFAFKNALGKTFLDLLNCREFTPIAAMYILTASERIRLLNKKLISVGESKQYQIGTVQHSLASTLIRVNHYQNRTIKDDWRNDLVLLQEFKKMGEEWNENKNYPLNPFLLFALHLNRSCGITVKQTTAVLLKNASERLLSVFGSRPRFDLRQTTTEILREHGMTTEEMEQVHNYIILRQHLILLSSPQIITGDFYQEFWDRARHEHSWINRHLAFNATLLNVPTLLHKKWRIFINKLPQHPWIRAKAKENLLMAKQKLSPQAISQESQKLITECMSDQCSIDIKPLAQFPVGEIFEELINLIPFVGAIYNMEEGIRHHDWLQAVLGTISLGIDGACLIYDGLNSGINEAKMNQRLLPKNDQKVIKVLEQAIEQTSDLSVNHWTDDLNAITIDPDPYDLTLPEAHIPVEFREQAARVRAGEKYKQWKGYEVVYIIDQDRVVPIKSSGGGFFYEIDWHTEQPNYGKMIMREPGEKYYTKVGLKGGSGISRKIRNRIQTAYLEAWSRHLTDNVTLDTLANFLPGATNVKVLPDFTTRFLGKFELTLDKNYPPAIAMRIYKDIYQRSPTFRRLFNYATERPGDKYRIKITSTISPQVNIIKKQVKLPNESTMSLVPQYINLAGEAVNFSSARMYLHEMLHVLSDLDDPLRGVPRVFNRGPIVYLTERILFESGHVSPGRLCYQISLADEAQSAPATTLQTETLQIPTEMASLPVNAEKNVLSDNLPWYTDVSAISAAGDSKQGSWSSSEYATASSNSSAPIQLEKLLNRRYLPPKPLTRPDIRNLVIKKVIAEDLALDLELNKNVNYSEFQPTVETIILAERLPEQNTITNLIRYNSGLIGTNNVLTPKSGAGFHSLFNSILEEISDQSYSNLVKISNNCLLLFQDNLMMKINNIIESCYLSSITFRKLLIRRASLISRRERVVKWNIVLNHEYDENYLTNSIPCFRIDDINHIITLFNHEAFAYLGETGIQRLSLERQSISAMVAMCLKDKKFPASKLNANDIERGVTVYLTNKILHETGYAEPIQLTCDLLPLYALADEKGEKLLLKIKDNWKDTYEEIIETTENRMLEQQNILLAKTTNARRLAEIQDRYLATLEMH